MLQRYRDSGDLTALGTLYDRYLELVYGLCLKYLKESARAQDAAMGIFEVLVEKVQKQQIEQFRPWLYVVARNFCLMQLRKEKKNLTISLTDGHVQIADVSHPEFELPTGRPDDVEALNHCLQQLSNEQRECVQLFYYQNKSYREIAELQKLPLGQVRSHLQNGRRNLRICVEQQIKIG